MTDINVANGFILRQQISQSGNADSGKKISDGFMQSLRQTGSKITDMGSSSGKTAAKPVKVSGTIRISPRSILPMRKILLLRQRPT